MYEKISDIFEFVQSCLADESLEFNLVATSEGKFSEDDMEKTLYDCKCVWHRTLWRSLDLPLFPFLQTHSKCSTTVHCADYTNPCCSGRQLLEGGSAHAGAVHVEVIILYIYYIYSGAVGKTCKRNNSAAFTHVITFYG